MTCIVCSRRSRRTAFGRGRDSINAFAARWIWYSVTSGFFPPQPVRLPRQKQAAHLSEKPMPTQRLIVSQPRAVCSDRCFVPSTMIVRQRVPINHAVRAHLEMTQAQFAFFVLQATFDRPAGERHMQQNFQRNTRRRIRQKVLLVRRIQHVAGMDQPPRAMHFFLAFVPEGNHPHLPDHRPVPSVFDVETDPRLIVDRTRMPTQILRRTRRPRRLPTRIARPARQIPRNLQHKPLAALEQSGEESRLLRVPDVGRDPLERQPVARSSCSSAMSYFGL